MSTFSQTSIDAFVQSEIDTLTCTSCSEDFLSAATMVSAVTDIKNTVATVNDLPDLLTTPVGIGTRIYVQSIKSVVVAIDGSWIGLDGRRLRRDFYLCKLYSWGNSNGYGQLGFNDTVVCTTPRALPGTNWGSLSAGNGFTNAVTTNGILWTWGCGGYGVLGTGFTTSRSSPGTTAGGGTTWCLVSVGQRHSAAIKTDGTLWTWGHSYRGVLGNSTDSFFVNRTSPGTTTGGGTTWCLVSAGYKHNLAVKTDGTIWAWGCNSSGQLGDTSVTNRASPMAVAGSGTDWCCTSAGKCHSIAVKTNGTLWTWGSNTNGALGTDNTTNRSSPGTTAGGGTDWCSSAGGYHTSFGIKTDGTLWTWGRNTCGVLGDGTLTSRSSPGTTAGGGTTWCRASINSSFAPSVQSLKTDGTLWQWGWRFNFNCSSSPVNASYGLATWANVSTGEGHRLAISRE